MKRLLLFVFATLFFGTAFGQAAEISGQYVESRNCDVWTGPCFANAEMNLSGKHAILAWQIDKGTVNGTCLDGLAVVAVVTASDTLGLEQTGPGRAIFLVDGKADGAQQKALIHFAALQCGGLARNIVAVHKTDISLTLCDCKEGGCAKLSAGGVNLETRCIDHQHDTVCGNESAFYPPLTRQVEVRPAIAVKHGLLGNELGESWSECDRRGAYVGTFAIR